jgi:hypothetical protein
VRSPSPGLVFAALLGACANGSVPPDPFGPDARYGREVYIPVDDAADLGLVEIPVDYPDIPHDGPPADRGAMDARADTATDLGRDTGRDLGVETPADRPALDLLGTDSLDGTASRDTTAEATPRDTATAEDLAPDTARGDVPTDETPAACASPGTACVTADTCCAGLQCRPSPTRALCCAEAAEPCTSSLGCCGWMLCAGGRCQCRTAGQTCVEDRDCCEGLRCAAGTCG